MKERPSRYRHTYVCTLNHRPTYENCIPALHSYLSCQKKENINTFQVPYVFKPANVLKHPWHTKHEPVSIMFDKRSDSFLELLSMNKLENTLQIEFWKKRPYIIKLILSKFRWQPSVHNLGTHILFVTGLDAQSSLADSVPNLPIQFVVHSTKSPFTETNRVVAA